MSQHKKMKTGKENTCFSVSKKHCNLPHKSQMTTISTENFNNDFKTPIIKFPIVMQLFYDD